MRRLPSWILCLSLAYALLAPVHHAAAQSGTTITLRIGDRYRGPDLGFYGEPNVVAVPGRVGVYYVQDASSDVYRHGNYWYMNHDGDWYRASDYRGPWVFVGYRSVPQNVYTVPSQYRRWTDYRDVHYDWARSGSYGNGNDVVYTSNGRTTYMLRIGDRYRGPDLGFYDEPRLVTVRGRSGVYYVQDSDFDVYRYGNNWYMNYNGDWYRASSHRGPWIFVGYRAVPRTVTTVPARYRKHWRSHKDVHYTYRLSRDSNRYGDTSRNYTLRIGDRYRGPNLGFYDTPNMVRIPGTRVSHAMDSDFDVYRYGNYWYMNYNGDWYRASSHRGPWIFVGYRTVPREVYTVPAQYRRRWSDYRDMHYDWSRADNGDTHYSGDGTITLRIGDRYRGPALTFYDNLDIVAVPGGRGVYYVRDSDYDIYRYGNTWYYNYNGDWYRSSSYRGPWVFVGYRSVPRDVYTVPAGYRRHWRDYRDVHYIWTDDDRE